MHQNSLKKQSLDSLKEAFYTLLNAEPILYQEICAEIQLELMRDFSGKQPASQFEAKDIEALFQNLSKLRSILDTKIPEAQHQELVQEAKRYFKDKNYESAFQTFRLILERLDAPEVSMLLNAATSAYYSKHFEDCEQWVDQALAINPTDNSAMVLKALVLMEFKRWSDALRLLHQAQERNIHSKLIERSISTCREKIAAITQNKNVCKRRWRRLSLKKTIQINDFGSYIVVPHEIKSLSAGGCLIKGSSLPREFQFRLELSPKTQIYGVAKVVYTTPEGDSGVRFDSLSQIEQLMLDETITQMASHRRH